MGDRAYGPSSKPVPVAAPRSANGTANGGGVGTPRPPSMVPGRVPPPPMYRPKPMQPPPGRRRSGRGWCCACCLWLTLVLVGLVFLGAIALGVFYVIYHPELPTFAVTSLRLAALNVSDSDSVTSRIEFTAASLRSKKSHAMSVEMDSKVGFQIGQFKSKRISVRVLCGGFSAGLAKPAPSPAPIIVAAAPAPTRSKIRLSSSSTGGGGSATTDAKCKLRVKIWIWTF
ncbi:hypothetical protein TRIUR3_35042 [Triticum urartu]|uniref:Late embryogenesis abundant protein LEA-2 subgroup domain-containing protein n=2 Tax=Triticum TaxID=4564 RepID=A0A9R0VIV8_TRITD|nr:hypothetical protein TRIUR3_35042 [Triticum urartu]VAH61134.1 unnamed protein product [Triticum turgidum subsp. durum]